MPSPLRLPHGECTFRLGGVLLVYGAATPGVAGADNATAILGKDSEPQPDLCLRILPEFGGNTRVNRKGYLVGPPELVVEIAHSSEAIDLHTKREDYHRAGVLEYLVVCLGERQLRAFDLSKELALDPASRGVYPSVVFPGLWIDVQSLFSGNTARLLNVAKEGLESPEHAAFVKRLAERKAVAKGRAKRR